MRCGLGKEVGNEVGKEAGKEAVEFLGHHTVAGQPLLPHARLATQRSPRRATSLRGSAAT